ncbi:ATP-binding cassette domain-containing protein [Reinekea forsetii]|nr:ATP-binding cassette domain-containing protein [Reinekea forsetii]
MSFIIKQLTIHLNQKPLFDALNLTVANGEIAAVMGPSGSGKSTLLAAISGTLAGNFQMHGDLILNDQSLKGVPIEKRGVGILFQDDLLFPHLDVCENLIFGLPASMTKKEKLDRVHQALMTSGLEKFEHRDVSTLSGGQRARVSLLRTLLSNPRLILLDEPFSKLDTELRAQFRERVFEQIQSYNIPALLVTHDKEDVPEGSTTLILESHYA